MSKAEHRTIEILAHHVRAGYGGARPMPDVGPGLWQIIAAAPVGEMPPRAGWVRVIVAPYTRGPR